MGDAAKAQKGSIGSRAGLSPKPKGLVIWINAIDTSMPNKRELCEMDQMNPRVKVTLVALGVGIHRRWSTTPLQAVLHCRCKPWFIGEPRFDDGG
ncbi:hypothetical protein DVH24_005326 [Malus domestica]|uniref:Uncharacterized protein n=1 Tax=Malus domestica TaxID=3750 RepID=A0A498KR45_MALDO|nr:hypothetical protein DVH24_005326 [Malus domestica]